MKCPKCRGLLEKVERYDASGQEMLPNLVVLSTGKPLNRRIKRLLLCTHCNLLLHKRRVRRAMIKIYETDWIETKKKKGMKDETKK